MCVVRASAHICGELRACASVHVCAHICGGQRFVCLACINLIPTEVIREEETSTEKMLPPDWTASKFVVHLFY